MNHALYTTRILVVALILPLAFAAAALIAAFVLADELPSRIAVHWDLAGHPDGYGSSVSLPITLAAVCIPIIAIFGGAVVLLSHRGPLTPLAKLLAVSSTWVTLVVSVVFLGMLLHPGVNPAVMLAAGLGAATVVAVGLWFVMPRAVRGVGGSVRLPVDAMALLDGERASWIRATSASRGMIAAMVGMCVLLGAAVAVTILSTAENDWWLSLIPVVVLLFIVGSFAWTVRVDASGVRVRSVLGFPTISIPLDQVASADVIEVQALAQYGGWGIRWALNRRIGVILRSGEALEVHRMKGLDLVVTVDDAATAAALLNGFVKRSAATLP